MTVDLDDDEDGDLLMWSLGWFGGAPPPQAARPPLPVHTPNAYIQECPYCHAIHETRSQHDEWCEEHQDRKQMWQRRKSPAKDDVPGAWECGGCDKCR